MWTRQRVQAKRTRAHLDIARAAIQIEMQVFDLTKLGKLVGNIFLRCLFVYIGDQDDPPLNSCAI